MFKKSDNQGDKAPKPAEKENADKALVAANVAAKDEKTAAPAAAQPEKAKA